MHRKRKHGFDAGDLVVMPDGGGWSRIDTKTSTGRVPGIIIDPVPIRHRIGVFWGDGEGKIDYEPIKWLKLVDEVIDESG